MASGALIASRPLTDNSFLTHLATGRIILESGRVPRADVYSFTAPGADWVVQSWAASVLYAGVERLAGGLGLRLLYMALAAILAAATYRLSRGADGLVARLGLLSLALLVFEGTLAPRPFLLGCLFLAVYMLASEVDVPGAVIAATAWLWVNVHGSFPLGLVLLVLLALGTRLDGRSPRRELRVLAWASLGTALGAVNPFGLAILAFPVELLSRQDTLSNVLEWRAPAFTSVTDRAFLVLVVVSLVSTTRSRSWRALLPTLVFTSAALLGSRNMIFATIVLVGTSAPGLGALGTIRSRDRLPLGGVVAAGSSVVLVLGMALKLDRGPHYDLVPRFPVGAVAMLEQSDVDLGKTRLVTHDFVGNLLTAVFGARGYVYFDDRFDMYPTEQVERYLTLLNGEPGWRGALDAVGADVVLWRQDDPLSQLLQMDPAWSSIWIDDDFALFCRRGSVAQLDGC